MAQFTVSHQLVSLDLDLERRIVKGMTELSIEPKTQSLTTLRLHCERPVVRAVQINGIRSEFRRKMPDTRRGLVAKELRTDDEDEGELEITIPEQARTVSVERQIADTTTTGETTTGIKALKLRIEFYLVNGSPGLVFSGGDDKGPATTVHTETTMYPSTTRSWVPCVDLIGQRSTWDLFFTVPACVGTLDDPTTLMPLTVVAAGELNSLARHPHDPLRRVFRYIVSTATPACTLGFAIGPFASACSLDGSLLGGDGESGDGGRAEAERGEGPAATAEKETKSTAAEDGENTTAAENEAEAAEATADETETAAAVAENETEEGATGSEVAKTSHNSKLRKATVDAIGGVFAFAAAGFQSELEATCSFIPEALAFHSQEFGAYPYATYKVVFMDGLERPVITCASLTILSTDFLHPATVIEQAYETRRSVGVAVAQQWFGTYVVAETWSDQWVIAGLAGYIASQFVRHNLGTNEQRYRLKRDITRVCHADVNQRPLSYAGQQPPWGDEAEFMELKAPVVLYMLDRRMLKGGGTLGLRRVVAKLLVTAMGGELGAGNNGVGTAGFLRMCRRVSGVDVEGFADQWVFGTGCPVFHFSYAFNRKKLAVEIQMHQESTNAKATAPWAQPQRFRGQMTARIREADGTPYEHVLDIRDSVHKFEVQFNTKYKRIRRSTKRFHLRQMAAAAEELSAMGGGSVGGGTGNGGAGSGGPGSDALLLGIDDDNAAYSNIAQFGAEDAREKRAWRVVEWGEDDEESLASATFEWIRMDSDIEWACIIHFEQPDFMWAAQLQKDRDVVAQLEAVDALQHLPSAAASTTLMRTVMDARVFYRVRVDAALALARFATPQLGWIGLHHLVKIYKRRYCLAGESSAGGGQGSSQAPGGQHGQGSYHDKPSSYQPPLEDPDDEPLLAPRLPRPNNFANIGEYFTQMAVLAALSNIRDARGEAPRAARALVAGALRYNDNSENMYSDSYFLAALVRALANGVIGSTRFARAHGPGAPGTALAEIERLRKLDVLVPSYRNVITAACLDALLRLSLAQPAVPLFNTALFAAMAAPEAYEGVRVAAIGGLLLHWGLAPPAAARFFAAVAADACAPMVATATARNVMQLLMVRAMTFGQQHHSLLFLEEQGAAATEHIDTDARLVGGLETMIDSLPHSRELQTIFGSVVYDSALPRESRMLLGALHMLVYQVVDCSVPPQPVKSHKKLKIKLGGGAAVRRKAAAAAAAAERRVVTGVKPMRSNASSDSEDMPLVLAVSEPTDVPLPLDSAEPLIDVVGEPSAAYSLPPIAGTRPPPPATSDTLLNSPAYVPQTEPAAPEPQPPRFKLKLKLGRASSVGPSTQVSVASYTQSAAVSSSAQLSLPATASFSPSPALTLPRSPVHASVPRISSPLAVHSPIHSASDRIEPAYASPLRVPSEPRSNETKASSKRRKSSVSRKPPAPEQPPLPSPTVAADGSLVLSAGVRKTVGRILRRVMRHPSALPFLQPVDVVRDGCPTYYDVVKHPIDLSIIKPRFDGSQTLPEHPPYTSVAEFAADMRLMFANCFLFNPEGTPVYDMGKAVETLFNTEWANAGFDRPPSEDAVAANAAVASVKSSKRKPSASSTATAASTVGNGAPADLHKRQKRRSNVHSKSTNGQTAARPVQQPSKTSTARATATVADADSKALDDTHLDSLYDPDTLLSFIDQQEKKPSAAPPPPIAGEWKPMCRRVLLRLQAQPSALEFMAPVDPVRQNVPTYFDIVKKPMDLATIRKKLDRANEYQLPDQFRDDVCLVISNCLLFNPSGSYVHQQALALRRAFEEIWSQNAGSSVNKSSVPLDLIPKDIPLDQERARAVVNSLKKHDSAWPFLKPVDPVALGVPTYFDIVKNPMDLSTIQRKISKKSYRSVADFVADIQLIVDDCFMFNPPDSPVHECGKALHALAAELLAPDGWDHWLAPPTTS
ncbi:Bromodomain-domain-containing protein [Coemansia reversa NRRL 1564]|uniref:Transcription initiation factor TFIID subunit 2 n=1 Tax=Coemansia reversa (strain ATCC 12441 / NRRL 1564) TaxID=763665 RepID=A0A2G5BB21_COERN|nr:Bromodomain-domain-containing protein [Coemansia reversa NRRL 1564]|eukprot:PIA16200.1 Bromodomain-domain-containing protein [Coemansia reversa NRRL 1564]